MAKNDQFIYDFNIRHYLSKEEIAQKLGSNFHEDIWKKIKEYRKNYAMPVGDLKKNDDGPMFIVLSPFLMQKEISVHMKLLKLWKTVYNVEIKTLFAKDSKIINDYETSHIADEVIKIAHNYGYSINKKILLNAYCEHNREELGQDYIFSLGLFEAFETMDQSRDVNFDENLVYGWLSKIDKSIKKDKMFRLSNAEGIPGSYTDKYMGFKTTQLQTRFSTIAKFVNSSIDYPVIMKAAFVFYYIKYGLFFEKYNDLIAILSMYYVVGHEFGDIIKLLGIIGTAIKQEKKFDVAYRNSLNSNSDTTYIVWEIIDVISESINNVNSIILKDSDKYNMPTKKEGDYAKKKKANIARIEFPQLSKKASLFLITHNKPSSKYTLENYQDFCRCSYETSRYSMELLTKLGFYSKLKQGKKFIYSPTDKIKEI